MSKKHFIALASAMLAAKPILRQPTMGAQWRRDVDAIADVCAEHNAQFNRQRFLEACGV